MPRLPARQHEDMTNQELLEVVSWRKAIDRGRPIPKRLQRRRMSPAQRDYWQELNYADAMFAQTRILVMGRTATDPKMLSVITENIKDAKDRVTGKPTEKVQIAQAVRIVVGGVDPGRLPDSPPVIEAKVVKAPPDEPDRC